MEERIVRSFDDELLHWSEACIREKKRSNLEMWVVWNIRDHEMQNWPVREKIPSNWKILFSTREDEKQKIYTEEELKGDNDIR